jgi:histidyl-tRNA synthetase
MSKIKNISGFPEWLPSQKLVEDQLIEIIKTVYKSYGFTPIETPAVELKSTLSSKGVIDKEIYLLKRASSTDETKDEDDLALHFDLTVPFARYVAQHFNELVFPFKRYQLQKVWRGERPQKGRFREFYQFDIDIVARENLPLASDAEILSALYDSFKAMTLLGNFCIRINNRKVLLGLYESLGLSEDIQKKVILTVDKLDKIQVEGVKKELLETLKLDSTIIDKIISYTQIRTPINQISNIISTFESIDNQQLKSGLNEIKQLASLLPTDSIVFDLSLARGLDYYTGTIFEIYLVNHPEFGTVSSGGRYEDLAGQFTNQKLPGVGGSIGLSRLMDLIFKKNLSNITSQSPATALITVLNEESRQTINNLASKLRLSGISIEVFLSAPKLGKQIEYADKKGISFCIFLQEDLKSYKLKNLISKEEKLINTFEDLVLHLK